MGVLKDLRSGIRLWARSPVFALLVILTLALAIGLNSAIFAILDRTILHPFPLFSSDRLVTLWETNARDGVKATGVSPANFTDWQSQADCFQGMMAFAHWTPFIEEEGGSKQVEGAAVSANFFPLLGVQPLLGRLWNPSAVNSESNPHVVVISYRFWQNHFGGDRHVLGRSLALEELNSGWSSYTVIGVMPAGFDFPFPLYGAKCDIWEPILFPGQRSRRGYVLNVIARLKEGVPIKHARAEMDAIAQRLERNYPLTNLGWRVLAVPLPEQALGNLTLLLFSLFGASASVLLIACLNISSLLLARFENRKREFAVRIALGAGRVRLVLQLLSEYLILAVAGAALGLILSYPFLQILRANWPEHFQGASSVPVERAVLLFTLGAMLLSIIVFGSASALRAVCLDTNKALKDAPGGSDKVGRRFQKYLAVGQIAISLALFLCSALLARSIHDLRTANLGFKVGDVFVQELVLPGFKYEQNSLRRKFVHNLLSMTAQEPGIDSVATSSDPPGNSLWETHFRCVSDPTIRGTVALRVVSPGYFATLDIPLLEGRLFKYSDSAESTRTIIVDAHTAAEYWPHSDPLGKKILLEYEGNSPFTVVGVVGGTRSFGLGNRVQPQAYVPFEQLPLGRVYLTLRTARAGGLAAMLRSAIGNIDSDVEQGNLVSLAELRKQSESTVRFQTLLFSLFAGLALLLALVGVFGITFMLVSQRRREIAVRMSLGALPKQVASSVLLESASIALTGSAVGILLALAAGRELSGSLYGVSNGDAATFLGGAAIICILVLAASFIPAKHAARIDPMIILRDE